MLEFNSSILFLHILINNLYDMAFIKKFNSTTQQWEIVSSTNARGIRVDNESLFDRGNNVSEVLESLQTDVNDLKQNVTWLAKYGGGGSGGSGGGIGGSLDAEILVNGKATNSEIIIGKDGLNIEIQCSNQKLLWTITAVANASINVKGVSNAKSLNIKLSEWEKAVGGGASLNITAYNAAQIINIYWNGTIKVSSVKLECDSQITALYSKFNETNIPLSYTLGSTGVYKMYVNDVQLDSGRPYYQLNGVYTANCGDINTVLKPTDTEFFIVGINKLKFKLEDVNNPEIFYEVTTDLVLTSNEPIIYNITLSTNPEERTEIVYYSDPFSVNVPFIVYYNSTGSFTYCINYTDSVGKTSEVGLANNIQYNQYIPNSSVLFYDITPGDATVTIKIHNVQTSAEFEKTYYVTLVEPASGLLDNPHDEYETTEGDNIIVTTDKIFDFNASNAIINQDNSTWAYTNKLKDNTVYTAEIVNINALSSQISLDHSMRLQNAAHLHIPFSKTAYTKDFVLGKFFGFTIEISYKADYHPDDDRTILQWGSAADMNYETHVPLRGILIRDHDLYIGSTKVLTLNDDSHVNIGITFYTKDFVLDNDGNISGEGTYYIYIDGVIEAVDNVPNAQILPGATSNIDFYIAASQFSDDSVPYSTNYCDMDLYRFVFYNKCLAPYDILIDYLNNLATANFIDGKPDTSYIDAGLKRNFITYDETTKTTDSLLYTRFTNDVIGGSHFDNTEDDLTRYFNVGNFVINGKLSSILSNYEIPVPIVFLKIDEWSWTDFISPSTGATKLEPTTAQFQYYDQKQNDTMNVATGGYTITCTVSPQGTSTLADYIKNIDIEFNDTTIFCPLKNWLPEMKYTLKADIVDSSHSVNASIGKFINTEFGMDATGASGAADFYSFSPTVRSKFTEFQKSTVAKNCFPEVNLKHGVEGFPVFVVIQFKDIAKTLGIYQLILGRSSARNLGFEIVKKLTDNGRDVPVSNPSFSEDKIGRYNYPLVLTGVELETEVIEGVWIEFTENTPADWDHQALTSNQFEKTKFTGPFWQDDVTFYNKSAEVKFSSATGIANDTPVTNINPFRTLISNIIKMPVVIKRYSTTGSGVQQNYISQGSTYPKLRFTGSEWVQIGNETHTLISNVSDDKNALFAALPLQLFQRYFIIMMFFGLVDNFQKNMPIKFYKDKDGNWETLPLLGIYDMDTGLGQDNQAVASVKENMWLCGITNENNNFTEAYLGSNYSTPVATGNKMWFIDCELTNEGGAGGNARGSMWATAWYDFVNYMYNIRGVSLFKLADYYYENYFVKQTEGCGELLFNLTYISKYISKYSTSDSANKTNQIGKLHGRRRYSVKSWLRKRVMFLHSLCYAYGPTSNVTFLEGASCTPSVSINAAIGPSLYVTTNTPIILGYSNQGSANAYVLCNPNEEESIYFGNEKINFGSNFSSLSHTLTNPDQIIKIGTGDDPLYNVGFGSINTGSLCYLSEYDCSTPYRDKYNNNGLLAMSSDYMADKFCRTLYYDADNKEVKRSELRVIDFRNTYPMEGVTNYSLNLEEGFDKLQELHINNSCITNLIFPKNTSIRNFNISNSNIINLNINQQNFITELDLTNCSALQTLTISNCLNLGNIVIDRTNQSIQSISVVGCPKLKTVTVTDNNSIKTITVEGPAIEKIDIHDCNNLESVNVSIVALKTLEIYDCNNFDKLNFIVSDKDESTLSRESMMLTTFNCARTNLKYAGYGIDFDHPDTLESIVDLYYFKNLTTLNVRSCSQIEYIQLHNDFDKPIPLTETFNGCTSLKRVYGHFIISRYSKNNINGLFFDCSEFSIHGNSTTWNGKSILDTNGKTVLPPIKVINKNNYTNVTRPELFVSGKKTTNIKLNNETHCLYYAFRNTNCTTFDVYYIFNLIKTQTDDRTLTTNIEILGTFYGLKTPAFDNATLNNPDKTLFIGCQLITYLSEAITSNHIILWSPTNSNGVVTNDDGLFSPLVNIKTLSRVFSGTVTHSRWLLRRKSDNYNSLTSFSWWSCGQIYDNDSYISSNDIGKNYTSLTSSIRSKVGDFTDFFNNTPNITSVHSICNYNFIKFDTVILPKTIKGVYSCFVCTYGSGNIDVQKIFTGTDLEQISSSFICSAVNTLVSDADKCRFLIYESMFKTFAKLKILGYSLSGDSYGNSGSLSFNGGGMIKEIIDDGEYTTNKTIQTAVDFPYKIFRHNTVLQVCAGFFQDIINTSFGTHIPCLPGDTINNEEESLFLTNSFLQVTSRLFKNVNFEFTLSSNGFAKINHNKKLYMNEMFYRTINASTRSKIKGCIPPRFFYHGYTTKTTSAIFVTDWEPWTSKSNKINYGVNVTQVLTEEEAAGSTAVKYSYLVKYTDVETNTTTYKYTDVKGIEHDVYYGRNSDDSEFQGFYDCTEMDGILFYINPITYDQVTDEIIETPYANPGEDPFFGTDKTDIDGQGTTGTEYKYTITYQDPRTNIIDLDKCFYGCIGLEAYDDIVNPEIYNEHNILYIPKKYTFKKEGSKWVKIDHTDEWVNHEYLGFWVYNGNPDSLTDIDTENYLYLDTEGLSPCVDKFNTWNDSYIDGVQQCSLNYISAPDILRYCTNSTNTKVTGLFDHCGLNYPHVRSGYMNPDEYNNYFITGLTGRLCPYMFYNLSNISDVSYMFRWCRRICSFNQDGITYFIPKDMFNTYAKNVNKFIETFKGVAMQPESNIKVFGSLNQNLTLDLRCMFSCVLYCPGETIFDVNANMFVGKNISNCSGIFSAYDINAVDSASITGYVQRQGSTDGYNYVPRKNIKFTNMFSDSKVPDIKTTFYTYYKSNQGNTNCEFKDTQIQDKNYNFSKA